MSKKNYFIAIILGLICSFGQPPYNFILPAICSLALLFHLLELCKTNKNSFWLTYSFGYGYCIYSHNWFSTSLFAYGEQLLWLYPIGIIFIPAFFAFYFGLAGIFIHKYAHKNIFLIALIWIMMELIRSYGYIELPWLLIGYIWSKDLIISQSVSLFGIYGLSFLTIIWAGALKEAYHLKDKSIIYLALISYILCIAYGVNHLKEKTNEQDITVRIVQPNIDLNIASRVNNRYQNLVKAIRMSSDSKNKIDYIIWPEGAFEYNLNTPLLDLLKHVAPQDGYLIFNANRVEEKPLKVWNSLITIDNQGEIIDYHDKIRLVALGEYIPLRSVLPFINKITPGSLDFSSGNILKPLNTKHKFLPSICYESTFTNFSEEYYTWIINLTNDGWFGKTIGPSQHLAMARYRSIELGIPMARSALTGISAIIDSFGQVIKQIPLLTEGVIDAKLPNYIEGFTYYRKYGNYALYSLIISVFTFISIFTLFSYFKCKKKYSI